MVEKKRTARMKRAAAAAVICILVVGGSGTAYATNLGNIQRTVQIWMHGDQTTATLEVNEDGGYTVTAKDEDGSTTTKAVGGGVTIAPDGSTQPASAEDIIEDQLNQPEVSDNADGTVTVYYKDQTLDITDRFNSDGVAYIQLKDGDDTLYMTVKRGQGYATSKDKYPDPASFNAGGK
ncbi:MAG: hypothetical protein Q4C56_03700 [Peptococcaceae bacterium]|nr:hypothetical protein [Peptococcaceae bacterium]